MPRDPQQALLDEFASYYNADELPLFIDSGLEEMADQSGDRLVQAVGPEGRAELAGQLRSLLEDRWQPLLQQIEDETLYDWRYEGWS
ncbi:MAG TPA: hypothetical protein VIL72_02000, partial [Beijerinckiaceae bacterium]